MIHPKKFIHTQDLAKLHIFRSLDNLLKYHFYLYIIKLIQI